MPSGTRRALQWLWLVPALLLVAVAAFVVWGLTPLGPSPSALAALSGDSQVTVSRSADGFEFAPNSAEPTAAVVFYPGGRVDARSYAILARDVAREGYLVIVPVMPLSLAVLSPNAADKAIASHPEITRWVIGGHSLGGSMAAQYAADHRGSISGLVLLASYPPNSVDLSDTSVRVASVLGTQDTVINRQNWQGTKRLLPTGTRYLELAGGNHAQFGSYGPQPGDTPRPELGAAEQRAAAVAATVAVLGDATR